MAMIRKPTNTRAAQIRADLKALGIKANVRFFNWQYRIVLPVFTPEAAAELRDYLVLNGLGLAGGHSATDATAYQRAWSVYQGRGQIFAYEIA